CTRDPDYLKKIEADYDKDLLSTSKILVDIFFIQLYLRFSKIDLKVPVLFLIAGDDKLVDNGASKRFFKKLKVKDKTLIEYPGMYHSLSVDLGKEKVFSDILKWAEGRI
ncbi:MAG: alpha/beta hydrolase, partial [Candidatus Omnitrophica bacterium]|nr:alpha/beta hydrolase [Candidatus Omnitrophota bacterium]